MDFPRLSYNVSNTGQSGPSNERAMRAKREDTSLGRDISSSSSRISNRMTSGRCLRVATPNYSAPREKYDTTGPKK